MLLHTSCTLRLVLCMGQPLMPLTEQLEQHRVWARQQLAGHRLLQMPLAMQRSKPQMQRSTQCTLHSTWPAKWLPMHKTSPTKQLMLLALQRNVPQASWPRRLPMCVTRQAHA